MRLAVFVGTKGRGSNLRAIHAATQDGRLSGQIALVIGSKPDAPAILWAQETDIRTAILNPNADDYAQSLLTALKDCDAIALAGYLRRLPAEVVSAFRHRIVNIHPALLPAFGGKGMYGLHVQEAALAYGVKVAGCTVHLVDEEYDTGPILLQRAVPVFENDTPETLAARILPEEHTALIEALQLLATGRIRVEGRKVTVK